MNDKIVFKKILQIRIFIFDAVFVCNGVIQSASGDVFSGYVSSDPPNRTSLSNRPVCGVQVRNLPPNATVRFEVKDLQVISDGAEYSLRIGSNQRDVEKGDVILRRTESRGQINVQTTITGFADDTDLIRFKT